MRIEVRGGRLVVSLEQPATTTVTRHGYLRIPATLRHRTGLRNGDRLLLVARTDLRVLSVYPPAALDALFVARSATDGEPA